MIRYILVDDHQKVLENVKAKIDIIRDDYELEHVCSYDSSKKAYEEVNESDYDLLIVDFEMPVYNGIELAKKIGADKKIIFLTSTTDNERTVINSLDISGYLSKPFEIEEFEQILKNKVIGNIRVSPDDRISLSIGVHKDVQFNPNQVYYASKVKNINENKPDKNCIHIYGKNDKILFPNVRMSINDFLKKVAHHRFEKISKQTVINVSHLKERDHIHIRLHDCSQPFEVGAQEKKNFIAKLRSKMRF